MYGEVAVQLACLLQGLFPVGTDIVACNPNTGKCQLVMLIVGEPVKGSGCELYFPLFISSGSSSSTKSAELNQFEPLHALKVSRTWP